MISQPQGRAHWAFQAVKEPVVLVASTTMRVAKIALHLVAVAFSLLLTFHCFCISPYFYTTLTTSYYKVVKKIGDVMGLGYFLEERTPSYLCDYSSSSTNKIGVKFSSS